MKKQIVASVLLASMMFVVPGYAEYELTPDDNNSIDKYKSPLEQSYVPIANESRQSRGDVESDAFAKAAAQLTQGSASGKPALEQPKALQKAEKQAEEVLSETDENFESSPDKEYPGFEYQARRQVSSLPGADSYPAAEVGSPAGVKRSENLPVKEEPAPVKDKKEKKGKKGKEKNKEENLPLVITGNDAQYASESGDFIIEGNVRLKQGPATLTSTRAVGNTKTGDVWLLEGGTLQEPTNRVNSRWAHYNFNKETGELLHLKGASSPDPGRAKYDYYEAPHGIIENGMLIIDQGGMTTRCPAVKHHPCLSVKAKTITIIPNDRIIARGVQVFAKGKHIYSRDVWINDLQKKSNQISPHIGWDDEKGWYVSLEYSRPIGNPLLKNPTTFYMEQIYYTKSKYKPFYGIRHDEKDFYVRVNRGYIYDSDNDELDEGIWLHKKIDWGLYLKPHRIAKGLPLSIDGYITHGLWKYTDRNWESWHTDKVVYLRHDRFYPLGGKKLYVDLMVGRKWVGESYGNFRTWDRTNRVYRRYGKNLSTNIYHGTIGYRFSDKWNIWTTYHNEHRTSYLFSKGQPDFTKDWGIGIAWNPDKHNSFTIYNRRNMDSSSRTHGNYTTTFTWRHRFCCEVLSVSYQKKHYNRENEWTVKFDFLNW